MIILPARFPGGRWFQLAFDILAYRSCRWTVADVHQPAGLLGITRVQLDELEIVDVEEGFGGLAVPVSSKNCSKPSSGIERAPDGNVGNAKGDMRDAAQRRDCAHESVIRKIPIPTIRLIIKITDLTMTIIRYFGLVQGGLRTIGVWQHQGTGCQRKRRPIDADPAAPFSLS